MKESVNKIFISYSHQDSVTAQGIARFLLRQGYDVWIDVEKLISGQEWATSIDEAMKEANIFLSILSRNSIRRPEVIHEISNALSRAEKDSSYMVLFVVVGNIHSSWFSNDNQLITDKVINYLNKVQYIQLDAKGTISIASMSNLLRALNGKLIYSDSEKIQIQKSQDYIYEAGIPQQYYDNEAGNIFYRVNASDLAPSTVFPFALDNQWLPDEILESDLKDEFLKKGFKGENIKTYVDNYQMKNLFLSLMHTRQIILNRASILNSHGLQTLYFEKSESNDNEKEAFFKLLKNGSIVIFLYGDNELTPYISNLPNYDTMPQAVNEWNKLCSRISMYCLRENWENPVDHHKEEFVKQCTTLAFNLETNDMLAECFGFDSGLKKEFLTVLKEIEMTVFLQTHITGTGSRDVVRGFSRTGFYRNFIVKNKSADHTFPVIDCIIDEEKPFCFQLKKLIDVFYNSMFTNYFNCSALIPYIKPEDTYIHQVYLKHGIKEVGTDELEYAFSEFFKNEKLLDKIKTIGNAYNLNSWSIEKIVEYRNSLKWLEYIELLEYITNRANTWEVDFSDVEKLVQLFVDSVVDPSIYQEKSTESNTFLPAYTFRLCIGSKVLDIVTTENVRKLKSYRGIFAPQKQNNLLIQFVLGDTTARKQELNKSIFAPITIFDGKTNHIGGNTYYEEICKFLKDKCNFVWIN